MKPAQVPAAREVVMRRTDDVLDAAIRDLVGYIRTTDAYFNEYGWQSYALLIERRNLIDTMDALRDVKP